MQSLSRTQQTPQSHSVDRWIEDVALERIIREQQEAQINQAINNTVPDPYSRMVIKLHAIDGWLPDHIALCAGVSKEDILRAIRRLRPRVLTAIGPVTATG